MAIFGTSLRDIEKAIHDWDRGDARTEKQCRDSLVVFLGERFQKAQLIKEYGKGRLRVDVYIKFAEGLAKAWHGQHECFIELKYGLKSRSALQRAIGQLELYVREKALPCLYVVCGAQDKNATQEIERSINEKNELLQAGLSLFTGEKSITLYLK